MSSTPGGKQTPFKTKLGKASQARMAELANDVAGLVGKGAEHDGDGLEVTILERLPLVCGRVIASFEAQRK